MNDLVDVLVRYGYLVVFGWVFAEQIGLPIPAMPVLLAAGAMAASPAGRGTRLTGRIRAAATNGPTNVLREPARLARRATELLPFVTHPRPRGS
jgi:hypothetical protein